MNIIDLIMPVCGLWIILVFFHTLWVDRNKITKKDDIFTGFRLGLLFAILFVICNFIYNFNE